MLCYFVRLGAEFSTLFLFSYFFSAHSLFSANIYHLIIIQKNDFVTKRLKSTKKKMVDTLLSVNKHFCFILHKNVQVHYWPQKFFCCCYCSNLVHFLFEHNSVFIQVEVHTSYWPNTEITSVKMLGRRKPAMVKSVSFYRCIKMVTVVYSQALSAFNMISVIMEILMALKPQWKRNIPFQKHSFCTSWKTFLLFL